MRRSRAVSQYPSLANRVGSVSLWLYFLFLYCAVSQSNIPSTASFSQDPSNSFIFLMLTGLARNMSQPHCFALALLSSVPKAEMAIIFVRGHPLSSSSLRMRFVASKPSITGIERSMNTTV